MGTLSDAVRPKTYGSVVGNKEIVKLLMRDTTQISTLLWGPTGCGKTSLARIYGKGCLELDAPHVTSAELKAALNNESVFILNEIQKLDRGKQQLLLTPLESGRLQIIATTTESPSSFLVPGLLSRFRCLRVDKPEVGETAAHLINVTAAMRIDLDPKVAASIASTSLGLRDALDMVETLVAVSDTNAIDRELYSKITHKQVTRASVESLKAALQKSIRGSDPDASAVYTHALLEMGELEALCRRLLVIASEDIGLAAPEAATHVLSCVTSAKLLGMPEGEYPAMQAALYMATLPKSNSVATTISNCKGSLENLIVPKHISHTHPEGYLYPHDYPNHWVAQSYLSVPIRVYEYGNNKREQSFKEYWKKVKEHE